MTHLSLSVRPVVKIIFFVSCFLCFYPAFSQDKDKVDKLLQVLKTQAEDTVKVNALNELAWEFRKTDAAVARGFATQAIRLSEFLAFESGRITGLNRLGVIAIYQKEFGKAEQIYLEVLKAEIKTENQYGIGRAQNQLGEIYRNKKDFEKALEYSLCALETFEALNNTNLTALVSNNIGAIYKEMGIYEKAKDYLIKSLTTREELGDQKNIGFSYLNVGSFYIELEGYSEAIEYLKKSKDVFEKLEDDYELAKVYNNLGVAHFRLKDYDSALDYYKKSLSLKKELELEDGDPGIYNNLGAIYFQKNDLDLALEYYLKSVSIQENNIGKNIFIDNYSNIGDIYYEKNDYEKAIKYYQKALAFPETLNIKAIRLKILYGLSRSYEKLRKHDIALKYSNQYIELSNSNEQNFKKAVKSDLDHEGEIIKKEKQISDEKDKNKNIIISGLIVVLLLTLLLFFSVLRGNRQKRKAQKIEELLRNQELKSVNAMMEGQEEERKRIARDLHDRLGSMLAMVKIHYKSVEENIENLKADNKEQYEKANNLLDTACEEVRKIAHDMISGVLMKFGLVAALNDLKATLEQTNHIKVDFIAHGLDNRLDNDTEISIYRIIQELIGNILKHAKAQEITIQVIRNNGELNAIVEDNGIGFNVARKKDAGMGFKNVASRVEKLKGRFHIDSTPGKGTTVTVDVPLQNN